MEKTIVIDDKEVRFKSTGATPIRFKAQFCKDYFAEIMKLSSLDMLRNLNSENIKSADLDGLDFEIFYEIAWTMAKTADNSIQDPITWLDTFEVFPMLEIIPELMDMIMSSIQSKKKM
ncbi:hypothetical protein AB1283_04220 [Bacillus sp. S13(2024)]|uniref:hypothetical protein n=1 Tax=unclassified Bacillus (in: firmicutes) TaxID=185979 RepID=UPI003D2354D9